MIVIEGLGRASVPLLSVISGILFVQSFVRRPATSILKAKVKTLIVPMVVWSVPMLALVLAESTLTGKPTLPLDNALDWINSLFALTSSPANIPLHFLRDVFLMAIYGCAILTVYRKSKVAGTILGVAIFLIEQIPGGFLLFRNQIATMYIFGLFLALLGHANWKPGWLLVTLLVGVMMAANTFDILETSPANNFFFRVSERVPRIAMSFLMWRIAYEIAVRPNCLRELCLGIEPHIFTIFCAHAILAACVGGAAQIFGVREDATYYPVIFIGQIIMFVVVGSILSRMLTPFPWLRGKARVERAHDVAGRQENETKLRQGVPLSCDRDS